MDERTPWRLHTRNHADPCVDENSRAKGDYVLRNIPEHPLSRILPHLIFSDSGLRILGTLTVFMNEPLRFTTVRRAPPKRLFWVPIR